MQIGKSRADYAEKVAVHLRSAAGRRSCDEIGLESEACQVFSELWIPLYVLMFVFAKVCSIRGLVGPAN